MASETEAELGGLFENLPKGTINTDRPIRNGPPVTTNYVDNRQHSGKYHSKWNRQTKNIQSD